MSNGDTTYMPGDDSTQHPVTGRAKDVMKGFFGNFIKFFRSNPIGAFLSAMLILALIVKPRKRKYKPSRISRSRKRGKKSRKGSRGVYKPKKRKKGRKGKKSKVKSKRTHAPKKVAAPKVKKPRKVKKARKSGTRRALPQSAKDKGFTNWGDYMAWLRSQRKK